MGGKVFIEVGEKRPVTVIQTGYPKDFLILAVSATIGIYKLAGVVLQATVNVCSLIGAAADVRASDNALI